MTFLATSLTYASPGTDHEHGAEGGAMAVIIIVGIIIAGFVAYSMFTGKKK